jgi:hypothetical protein
LAGLAGATRNVGVFLVAPLFLEWLRDARHYRWRGVYLALAPSGLIFYAVYLWWRFGDPLLFYTDQGKWGRQAAGPLATAGRVWEAAVEGSARLLDPRLWADPSLGNLANHLEGANNLYNLVFFVFAGVVLISGLRDLPPDLSVYAFLLVAPATLFGTPASPLWAPRGTCSSPSRCLSCSGCCTGTAPSSSVGWSSAPQPPWYSAPCS